MTTFFHTVLNLSLLGAVPAAAVLLLRLLLKNKVRKSWFVLLWILVFCRFCIPVSIAAHFSLFNSIPLFSQTEATEGITAAPDTVERLLAHRAPASAQQEVPAFADPKQETMGGGLRPQEADMAAPQALPAAAPSRFWAVLWFSGALGSLLLLALTYAAATRRLMKSAVPLGDLSGVPETAVAFGLRRPPCCYTANDPAAPCVIGLFRQRILLPGGLFPEEPGSLEEPGNGPRRSAAPSLRHVLLHEMVHVRRRDNLKKLISLILLCIHWFNPLMWAACVCFQRDLEQSCDEKVLSLCGSAEKRGYAESLYRMALTGGRQSMKAFVSFGETGVTSRIQNVLQYGRASLPMRIFAAVLTFLLCAGLMTNPAAAEGGFARKALRPERQAAYASNDGLYQISLEASPSEPVKLVDGQGLSTPVFSQDGSAVAFLRTASISKNGAAAERKDLYWYRFSDRTLALLAENVQSFCPAQEDRFYLSTPEKGILRAGGDLPEELLLPTQSEGDTKTCYDNLSLSPDGSLLAFEQLRFRHREDSAQETISASDGVWLLSLDGRSGKPVQIQSSKLTVEEEALPEDAWLPFYYSLPRPGKWSPDGRYLFIWQDVMGGSLRADGIGGAVYDVEQGRFVVTDPMLSPSAAVGIGEDSPEGGGLFGLLAYEENVRFTADGRVLVLSGGGRFMDSNKDLQLLTPGQTASDPGALSDLHTPGLIPAAPCISADGSAVYFAGYRTPTAGESTDWRDVYPLHRELYALREGRVQALTDDPNYRCESPVLSRDETRLFFGRIDGEGAMSLWQIGVDGRGLTKIADLRENVNTEETDGLLTLPAGTDPETKKESAAKLAAQREKREYPLAYDDYYGRGYWGNMIAFD